LTDLPAPRAVLFDLDGTLLDTAPDLAGALNRLRKQEGLPALPYETIRPHVSHGAAALTRLGFALSADDPAFEPLRLRLLDEYHAHVADETRYFSGMESTLETLVRHGLKWGIVTNKPGWLTTPLMARMAPVHPPLSVVSGDTLPVRKPDPAPLLLAAEQLGEIPQACVYIGDAERDVEAGRRAGMRTLIARYGYLGTLDTPDAWGADGFIETPLALCDWLQSHGWLGAVE
jgi:phosphoglycolate phosphatase